MYVSFQLLDLHKAECNTLEQTVILQSRLEFVYARGSQKVENMWLKMNSQECQIVQLRAHIKHSLTSNLDSAVWGVGTEKIRHEKAGGVVYLHRCAKRKLDS